MKRLGLALLFLLGFGLAGAFSAAVVAETTPVTTTAPTTTAPTPGTIAPGVRIAGVDVGELTAEEATTLLQDVFATPLVLHVGARELLVGPRQLGAVAYVKAAVVRALASPPGASVELVVSVQGGAVRNLVSRLAAGYDRAPVDARLLLRKGVPFVTKDVFGRRLDRLDVAARIVRALRTHDRRPIDVRHRPLAAAVRRGSFGPVLLIHRGLNRLDVYSGARHWRAFQVATGRSAYPTPLGRFQIVVKWRNPWWYPPRSDWAQGLAPVPPGPGNPLGTRWMGLSAPAVGIHGTPDAASVGYSASHGCIRMRIPEAEWLFNHVAIGTTVFIVAS